MDSCGTAFKGVSQTGEASIVARLWAAEAARSGGGLGRGAWWEGDMGGETLTTGPRHHSPSAWRPLSSRGRWPTGPGQARQDSEKLPQLESSSRADDEAAAQDSGFRGRLVSEKGGKRPKDGGWGGEGVPFTTRWNTRGEAGLREGKGAFGRGRVGTDRPACGRPGEASGLYGFPEVPLEVIILLVLTCVRPVSKAVDHSSKTFYMVFVFSNLTCSKTCLKYESV